MSGPHDAGNGLTPIDPDTLSQEDRAAWDRGRNIAMFYAARESIDRARAANSRALLDVFLSAAERAIELGIAGLEVTR